MIEEKWIRENLKPGAKGSGALFKGLATLGILTFVLALANGATERAWGILLVNFLFWMGISVAGVTFSAIQTSTNAAWGRPIKRIAEAMGAFMPVALVIMLVIFAGASHLYPWVNDPLPAKAAWLNLRFMVIRDTLAFVFLMAVSYKFVSLSLRPDLGIIREKKYFPLTPVAERLIRNWKGEQEEIAACYHKSYRLAPGLVLLYTLVFSLLAFDLIMSMEPHWYSTLFGAYFFISNLYLGLAALIMMVICLKDRFGLNQFITSKTFHDIGMLQFAFVLLWTYFFFSQFIVIWYGNLPEESSYIIERIYKTPWDKLAWVILFTNFIIPFLLLLSRARKKNYKRLRRVAVVIFCGMFLERYILILPAVWHKPTLPFGFIEIFITLGFFGMFALSYRAFMKHFPMMTITDPRFPTGEGHH